MRITQWGEYGVHFAVYIAKCQGEGMPMVTAAEIAKSQGIAVDYAQQILQRLRRGNIVESIRGPQGGYQLSRSTTAITLFDILVATEGDSFELICETKPLDAERCQSDNRCGLRGIWTDLRDHVNTFLKSYRLDKLVDTCGESVMVQIGQMHRRDEPVNLNR